MLLTQEKEDRIYNALVIGMALDDAYIYAGLTAQEIELVAEDTDLQIKFKRYIKDILGQIRILPEGFLHGPGIHFIVS